MAKKIRFNSKFIHDLFDEKNTIIRKSDGYKWHVVVCQWNIQHKNGWMHLNDENLSQFFDENNNFRFDDYDLVYIDYFKEFCKSELKQHGKEWLDNMPYGEAKENILKQMLGC